MIDRRPKYSEDDTNPLNGLAEKRGYVVPKWHRSPGEEASEATASYKRFPVKHPRPPTQELAENGSFLASPPERGTSNDHAGGGGGDTAGGIIATTTVSSHAFEFANDRTTSIVIIMILAGMLALAVVVCVFYIIGQRRASKHYSTIRGDLVYAARRFDSTKWRAPIRAMMGSSFTHFDHVPQVYRLHNEQMAYNAVVADPNPSSTTTTAVTTNNNNTNNINTNGSSCSSSSSSHRYNNDPNGGSHDSSRRHGCSNCSWARRDWCVHLPADSDVVDAQSAAAAAAATTTTTATATTLAGLAVSSEANVSSGVETTDENVDSSRPVMIRPFPQWPLTEAERRKKLQLREERISRRNGLFEDFLSDDQQFEAYVIHEQQM